MTSASKPPKREVNPSVQGVMSTETTYKMKAFELAGVALKHAAWVNDYDQGTTGEEGKQLFAKHKPVISEKEIEDIVVRTQQRCVASGIPQDKMDKIVAALRSNAQAPNATLETVQKQAEAEVAFAIAEVAKERAEQAAEMSVAQRGAMLGRISKIMDKIADIDKEIDLDDEHLAKKFLNPEEQKELKRIKAERKKVEEERKKAENEYEKAMLTATTDEEKAKIQKKYEAAMAAADAKLNVLEEQKKPLDEKMKTGAETSGTTEDKQKQEHKDKKEDEKSDEWKKIAAEKKARGHNKEVSVKESSWQQQKDNSPESYEEKAVSMPPPLHPKAAASIKEETKLAAKAVGADEMGDLPVFAKAPAPAVKGHSKA